MKKLFQEFLKSKNKIYFIIKHKGIISVIFATLTIIFGTYGFYDLKSIYPWYQELIVSVIRAFKLLGLNFPEIKDFNYGTIFGSITAIITVILTAVLFFFKEQINKQLFKNISNKEHIGIFGLGQISKTFLEDEKLDTNIVIIEKSAISAEEYRAKGYGFQVGDAFNKEFLEHTINLETMKYALISFGDDKLNIEFTKKIISLYKTKNIKSSIKLIVHINDKSLSTLFSKSFILGMTDTSTKINIKTFSYYEECARDLFAKYSLDGESMEYIKSHKTLKTVVAGDNKLIKSIVYKIIALHHFPNKNKHIIYIIDKNASSLIQEIQTFVNYGLDENRKKFPSIRLVAIELDYTRQSYFTHSVWRRENIENIIICYDDESINLKVGTMLHNKTYLADTIDKHTVPKIIMAIYTELELSDAINSNKYEYINMFTFANQKDIINKDHLINETVDSISKLIHHGYGSQYNPNIFNTNTKQIEDSWFNNTKFSDKLSNIAQAIHLDIKLKALGLKRRKNTFGKTKEELLSINRAMLNSALEGQRGNFSDTKLKLAAQEIEKYYAKQEYKVLYWPERFDNNLFNKLLSMEHSRWNAHHYLEGWKYSKKKNKDKKEHDCLIPIEKFDSDPLRITAIYDMYSFLYIPNYLAQTDFKIVPL